MAAKEPTDYASTTSSATTTGQPAGSGDSELQLKKRARRRLVGSIALALFAIIVLPLVMDREPAPLAPEIQVRIPAVDGNATAGKMVAAPAVKPPSLPPIAVPVAEPAADATKPAGKPALAKQEPAVSPAKSAEPLPVAQPTTASAPVAKPAAQKGTEVRTGESKAGETKAEPVEAKDSGTNSKWVVQLGAYQNSGNVAVLMSKLKEINVPAYTEKLESPQGSRTRVRAGPFPSKEAALSAQKRVRIIGVEGPVAPMSAK